MLHNLSRDFYDNRIDNIVMYSLIKHGILASCPKLDFHSLTKKQATLDKRLDYFRGILEFITNHSDWMTGFRTEFSVLISNPFTSDFLMNLENYHPMKIRNSLLMEGNEISFLRECYFYFSDTPS